MRYFIMRYFLTFILIFSGLNISLAFDYSEEDKNLFYNSFIEGYICEMTKIINQIDMEQSKKDKFLAELKKQINKEELVNSSWDCIKKYPINDIVSASVTCTADWSNKQIEKNKKLFSSIK